MIFFVWKGQEPDLHPYGACFHDIQENLETGVFDYLRNKGVETVILGGLAFDFCVKTTAIQLAKNGFKVAIYKKSTRSIAEPLEKLAIEELKDYNVDLLNTYEELLAYTNAAKGETK